MTLTHDTPAGKLVYDSTPDVTYDPSRLVYSARPPYVDHAQPHREKSTAPGFGTIMPRRMLESGPPAKHPWLTVELAERELAIQAAARDVAGIAEASCQ